MAEPPMVDALSAFPPYRVNRVESLLGAAYRTVTEIVAYYDRMNGYDEIDRLTDTREWLDEVMGQMFGRDVADRWAEEAKSPQYTPFAEASDA